MVLHEMTRCNIWTCLFIRAGQQSSSNTAYSLTVHRPGLQQSCCCQRCCLQARRARPSGRPERGGMKGTAGGGGSAVLLRPLEKVCGWLVAWCQVMPCAADASPAGRAAGGLDSAAAVSYHVDKAAVAAVEVASACMHASRSGRCTTRLRACPQTLAPRNTTEPGAILFLVPGTYQCTQDWPATGLLRAGLASLHPSQHQSAPPAIAESKFV